MNVKNFNRLIFYLFTLLSVSHVFILTINAEEDKFPDIKALELKQLLDSGTKIFLLNPLADIIFSQGHIPGSVNIRWNKLKESSLLPDDKNILMVTYCLGPR